MGKRVVGLDISSRCIVAVEVEGSAGKQPTLTNVHRVELPEGVARDSEVIDITEVSLAITKLWKDAGFQSKRVVLGVGNQRVLVRHHQVPVMPEAQLRQALPYLVADLLPVPIDETILDFYPIGPVPDSAPQEMSGLLVAALKESVETDVATIAQSGLNVVGVDLTPFAMLRTMHLGGSPAGTHMYVKIGARTTHLVITRDGVPQFIRTLPIGGEHIIDAIAEATNVGRGEAEEVKHRVGIENGANPLYRAASEAQLEVLRGILGSIRSTIGFYLGNHEDEEIQSILMLGLTARAPGYVQAVAEHVGVAATVVSPLTAIRIANGVDESKLRQAELELAAPIGLALGRS